MSTEYYAAKKPWFVGFCQQIGCSAMDIPGMGKLIQYAGSYGLSLNDQQAELLLRHFDLVCNANRLVNLTRITKLDEGIIKHIVDSLLYVVVAQRMGVFNEHRFVDIGTGAGYPGIPFAIVTGATGFLIDSVAKKIAAVNSFVDALHMQGQLTCTSVRIEHFAEQCPNTCTCVTARAIADLATLVEYAAPLLCENGMLIVSKSHIHDEELEHASHVEAICGMSNVSRETFLLPEGFGTRSLFTYQKVSEPHIKLPRSIGSTKRKPLWR